MTVVGGFDVHRKQITFDYVDTGFRVGALRGDQYRQPARRYGAGWASTARPGMRRSRWRAAPGGRMWSRNWPRRVRRPIWLIRPRPRGCGVRKGGGKTDRADARLLRTLLFLGEATRMWIPPAHVLEVFTLGRLYCALMKQRRAWRQHIQSQVFHQGCPPISALLTKAGREALADAELSARERQYVDTALRRIDQLTAEIDPVRTQLINVARRQPGCWALSGCPPVRGGLAVRGDHVGGDRRCPPVSQLRSAGALRRHGHHRVLLGRQTLAGASVPPRLPGVAVGHLRGG